MKASINLFKKFSLLTSAFAIALAANLAYGQWVDPAGTPPTNNAEAPLNISTEYQVKTGDLGAIRMRSNEYCDADGNNCFTPTGSTTVSGAGGGDDVLTVAGRCYAPLDNINIDGVRRNIIEEVACNPMSCEVLLTSRAHNDRDTRTVTINQTSVAGLAAIFYWQHKDDNPPWEFGSGRTANLAGDSWGGAWNDKSERAYTYYADDTKQSRYGGELQSEENESNDYTGYETFPLVEGATAVLDGRGSPYHTYVSAEVLSCVSLN